MFDPFRKKLMGSQSSEAVKPFQNKTATALDSVTCSDKKFPNIRQRPSASCAADKTPAHQSGCNSVSSPIICCRLAAGGARDIYLTRKPTAGEGVTLPVPFYC